MPTISCLKVWVLRIRGCYLHRSYPKHIHNPLLFLQQLAAQMALLAQMTVAQETIYVELGKEIVTLTQDAREICYVDQTTVILPWDLVGIGTAVMIP